jgi:hypothetical protein
VDVPIVPVEEFPPATPFTYHVTIVVVSVLLAWPAIATVAVNSAVSLICTVTAAGAIVTDVTVPVPAPPPQDEILSSPASATGSSTSPRIARRVGQPFFFPPAAANPAAICIIQEFLVCCLVICLGPLILWYGAHGHTRGFLYSRPERKSSIS